MSLWAWGIRGDGQWGGWEAGVNITKFSFRALFSLLIGCVDLAQEMKSFSPSMSLQSGGRLPREGAAAVVCGIAFAQG